MRRTKEIIKNNFKKCTQNTLKKTYLKYTALYSAFLRKNRMPKKLVDRNTTISIKTYKEIDINLPKNIINIISKSQ